MHVDADALSATGGVLARQQAHLDATRHYLDVVCDRPGALVGVLALFRSSYADAVAASTRGLADAARLARGLERAVTDFRDDVLEVDTGTAARFARTERMLHGADPAGGVHGPGAAGGVVGAGGAAAMVGMGSAPWAGPSEASLEGPRPSTGLARVLSAHAVSEAAGATGAGLSPTSSDGDAGRARPSAAATLGAVRGLHAQVGDVGDAVRGVEVGLGEALHGLADLDTYAAFTAGAAGASAASLADRLGATA